VPDCGHISDVWVGGMGHDAPDRVRVFEAKVLERLPAV
jgi:hypothetical protein